MVTNGSEQRYLSPQELSQYLGLSIVTIYGWTSQHKIPFVKLGRLVRFDVAEINAWMQTQKIEPYGN